MSNEDLATLQGLMLKLILENQQLTAQLVEQNTPKVTYTNPAVDAIEADIRNKTRVLAALDAWARGDIR